MTWKKCFRFQLRLRSKHRAKCGCPTFCRTKQQFFSHVLNLHWYYVFSSLTTLDLEYFDFITEAQDGLQSLASQYFNLTFLHTLLTPLGVEYVWHIIKLVLCSVSCPNQYSFQLTHLLLGCCLSPQLQIWAIRMSCNSDATCTAAHHTITLQPQPCAFVFVTPWSSLVLFTWPPSHNIQKKTPHSTVAPGLQSEKTDWTTVFFNDIIVGMRCILRLSMNLDVVSCSFKK